MCNDAAQLCQRAELRRRTKAPPKCRLQAAEPSPCFRGAASAAEMERPPKAPAKARSRGESAPELQNLLGALTLYLLSCAGVEGFINSSKTPRKKTAAEKAL